MRDRDIRSRFTARQRRIIEVLLGALIVALMTALSLLAWQWDAPAYGSEGRASETVQTAETECIDVAVTLLKSNNTETHRRVADLCIESEALDRAGEHIEETCPTGLARLEPLILREKSATPDVSVQLRMICRREP